MPDLTTMRETLLDIADDADDLELGFVSRAVKRASKETTLDAAIRRLDGAYDRAESDDEDGQDAIELLDRASKAIHAALDQRRAAPFKAKKVDWSKLSEDEG